MTDRSIIAEAFSSTHARALRVTVQDVLGARKYALARVYGNGRAVTLNTRDVDKAVIAMEAFGLNAAEVDRALGLGFGDAARFERDRIRAGEAEIVLDLQGPSRGTGWISWGEGRAEDLWAVREDGLWQFYAGGADEFRGEGARMATALRGLARSVGCPGGHGRLQLTREYRSQQETITEF